MNNLSPSTADDAPEVQPFRDRALPLDARVDSLLAQLTLDEKISMLHQWAPAVPRLGLAAFHTGTEVLHGAVVETSPLPTTVFPQGVGLGATWNAELLEQVGRAVATEVRAHHERDPQCSLNVWGPVVNLLRDPRWGRNEEGYSEDPRHTVAMATAYCRGLRGGDTGEATLPLATAPTLKHFMAYNKESGNVTTSSQVRPRVLREYDILPFQRTVESGVVSGVMPSYSALNGRPNSLSPYLAELRRQQPDLVVVTDAYAPSNLVHEHRYYEDRPHAYAAALLAGVDNFTDHDDDSSVTLDALRTALSDGLLDVADIDRAARRLLRMRMSLGEFDRPARPAERSAEPAPPEHLALAREAARQAMVLLKNSPEVLPLRPGSRVAVIGPLADQVFLDWYAGKAGYEVSPLSGLREALGADLVGYSEGVDRIALRPVEGGRLACGEDAPARIDTGPLGPEHSFDLFDWGEGQYSLRSAATRMFLRLRRDDGALVGDQEKPGLGWDVYETFHFVPVDDGVVLRNVYTERYAAVGEDGSVGFSATTPEEAVRFRQETLVDGVAEAARTAAEADVAVVVVGSHPRIPGRECHDRADIGLARRQEELLQAVHEVTPRTAAVLISGFPLAVNWAAEHVPTLLWSSHAGPELGNGLADTLTGRSAPAGRLPQTWYRSLEQVGDISDYDIVKSAKTYLYLRTEPLFPFGHGVGYTTFHYSPLRLSATSCESGDTVSVSVDITNLGDVDSDEIPQLYVRAPGRVVPRPLRELHGFERVRISAGTTRTVEFALPVAELAFWDVESGTYRVEPGEHQIMVGPSAGDVRQSSALTVRAEELPPRDLSGRIVRAIDFDDCHGVRLVDETRRSGEAVEAVGAGSWLLFRDVALRDVTGVVAQAYRTQAGPVGIEVCLDAPSSGTSITTLEVPEREGRWPWTTVAAAAKAEDGRHDVYLLFTGPALLASFSLTRDPETA
ncbi:glycoside hydrolase family 3 protein [Streptomyces capitiformicae]|uniref:Exo-alpha-(1->6)-L-arabinopyranosidase n=1 Tax=Streptomyces capitiformicae TaxID=2014920 RepID=A0A919GIQ1_9ACTN|nr:glycoside hydrolase family 3 protein [Streptomyces capitiformicae]GHH84721.1 sugar hydrolase [Streptomyces capitiformicae]